MRFEFELIYDWHDNYGFFPDEENCHEMFVGTSEELNNRVRDLRECGCKNIFFNRLGEAEETGEVEGEDPWEDEYEDPWEREYIRSVTGGDYGATCPWNAPGMRVSDFI